MKRDEMETEVRALGDKITKVIDEARAKWIEEYGGISSFPLIETGAVARTIVVSFTEAYRRVHGKRPAFEHIVSVITSMPPLLVAEAATQYGVPFFALEMSDLASADLAAMISAISRGREKAPKC